MTRFGRRRSFRRVNRRQRIRGRGLKSIFAMASQCSMNCNYKGAFNTNWLFGAGKYDGTYVLKNFLGIKEKPESDNMLEYLSDQYRKYIVNKITVKMYNFAGAERQVNVILI